MKKHRRRKVNHCHKLLCFVVEDDDDVLELGSKFLFTTREKDARKLAASDFSADPDDPSIKLRRAPEFDKHAPGPVPPEALLEAGWWITCAECQHRVSEEGCDECADDRGDDSPMPLPVTWGDMVFCSQECMDDYQQDLLRDKQWRISMTTLAKETFPGATVMNVWGLSGRPKDPENSVDMRLPGVEGRVNWRPYDTSPEGNVIIRNMDHAAFHKYLAEHKVRLPRPADMAHEAEQRTA